MAELPLSLRRRRPATTPLQQSPEPKFNLQMMLWLSRLLVLLALMLLLYGGYGLFRKAAQQQINHVYIDGVSVPEQRFLAQYLNPTLQGNYFSVDLPTIRDRALAVSWVDSVVVARAWPDAVVVRVKTRTPVARWGTGRFLSDNGVVFQPLITPTLAGLPMLHGPVSQIHMMMIKYHDVERLFAPLHLHLKEMYLTDRMTWFMQFDSGLRIMVDQNQTMSKLQNFEQLAQHDLQPILKQVAVVDLRYRNGLAIQWQHGQAPPIAHGQFVIAPAAPTQSLATKTGQKLQ